MTTSTSPEPCIGEALQGSGHPEADHEHDPETWEALLAWADRGRERESP